MKFSPAALVVLCLLPWGFGTTHLEAAYDGPIGIEGVGEPQPTAYEYDKLSFPEWLKHFFIKPLDMVNPPGFPPRPDETPTPRPNGLTGSVSLLDREEKSIMLTPQDRPIDRWNVISEDQLWDPFSSGEVIDVYLPYLSLNF